MKSVFIYLALTALISVTFSCSDFYNPSCGRVLNTNTCRTFKNLCKFLKINNGDYEKVSMSYCKNKLGIRECLIKDNPTTDTQLSTPWICGSACPRELEGDVCTYLVDAEPDTCRQFRSRCEFEEFKCRNQNETLYELAHISRCRELPRYEEDGNCF